MTRCPSCHVDVPSMTLWPCRCMTPDSNIATPTAMCDACRYAIHVALLLTPISGTHTKRVRHEVESYNKKYPRGSAQ